jgi:hypothetical protein
MTEMSMDEHHDLDATVEDMEHALDRLVGEIITRKEQLLPHSTEALNHALYGRSGPARTHFKTAIDLIAESPIDGALRLSVHHIGRMLFESLQSQHKLVRVARRVCSLDEPNWSRRMTIIDAAWQGIGSDASGYFRS